MRLEDCAREFTAIAAFASPPLPVVVLREETGLHTLTSSHDLIAAGMRHAAGLPDALRDALKQRQHALLAAHNAAIDALYTAFIRNGRSDSLAQAVYDQFQAFTRANVAAYTGREVVDMRFAPLADVDRDSTLHRAACDHFTLHRALCGETVQRRELNALGYGDVLFEFFVCHGADAECGQPI